MEALQKFLVENRNSDNLIENLDMLRNLTEQYKSYSNFYKDLEILSA